MPKEFIPQEVRSGTPSQVVGRCNTPVFAAIAGDFDATVAQLSPAQKNSILGFIDAASWLQTNTESAGGGLPGTADGKVTDGFEYALSLMTTQNATNMKNRIRTAYNAPVSKEKLKEQALQEFYTMLKTDVAKATEIAGAPGGPEAWVANRVVELEKDHEARRQQMIQQAAAVAAQAGSDGNGDEAQQ